MKRLWTAVACATALFATGAAQAAVVTFNAPGQIAIDNNTGVATYTEAGYKIVGAAAAFQLNGDSPQPEVLVGGFQDPDNNLPVPFSLVSSTGAAFALLGLDYSFFDLGELPGTLSVLGFSNGVQVASRNLSLAGVNALTHINFNSSWLSVTEVRFSGTSLFALDNVSAVPEPGTLALATGALLFMGAGMGAFKRRRTA